jgi:hypothetical protein
VLANQTRIGDDSKPSKAAAGLNSDTSHIQLHELRTAVETYLSSAVSTPATQGGRHLTGPLNRGAIDAYNTVTNKQTSP